MLLDRDVETFEWVIEVNRSEKDNDFVICNSRILHTICNLLSVLYACETCWIAYGYTVSMCHVFKCRNVLTNSDYN
jgi:hypothetical protein